MVHLLIRVLNLFSPFRPSVLFRLIPCSPLSSGPARDPIDGVTKSAAPFCAIGIASAVPSLIPLMLSLDLPLPEILPTMLNARVPRLGGADTFGGVVVLVLMRLPWPDMSE